MFLKVTSERIQWIKGGRKMKVQIPRGTQDILPEQAKVWQWIEGKIREVTRTYCYEEIRTPVLNIRRFSKEV